MIKHILVTGGLGHIGSALIRHISEVANVERVTILDNLLTQRYASLFHLPSDIDYTFIEGDVMTSSHMDCALEGVDAVVHLAAITDAEGSFDKSEDVHNINLDGTKSVIDACLRNSVRRLIFPSTTSVYGPISGIALEDSSRSDLQPQSPYAVSKLAAEDQVLIATQQSVIDGVVLRLGTIFGPSIGMRFHTAVNKFIYHSMIKKPLTVWEDAVDLVRPYLDLRDAVRAISFMLTSNQHSGEIYNVVTLNATLDQIIDEIKVNVADIDIEYTSTRMLNQVSYHVNDDKIRDTGFTYSGNLKVGIRDTYHLLQSLCV